MQEEAIKFLTEYRKHQVLWWGFGPTLLEDLCREKKFDVTEFLTKKDKRQCAELLMEFGDRKKYWWLPCGKKITDTTFNKTTCRWAFEYHNYSWFWRVILGLFTPVLLHRQVLKWINIGYGGYMYRSNGQTIVKSYLTIAADFNTVGGTLKSLGFSEPLEEGQEEVPLLQRLDDSLERVRRNMETAEQHREFVAEIDKKMKKSSLKIHSDKVHAGDDKQAALNACRSLIKNASEFFLEYIHIDFKYECYNKMKISSLGTMNSLNTGFLMRLSQISRTKQEKIITPTYKFLKASRSSLEEFIKSRSCDGYSSDWAQYTFEQHRDDALNYLTSCIEGCEKFDSQCKEVLEECKQDAELNDLLYDSIFDMSSKNNKQLEQLHKLKKFAENALQKTIGIIDMKEMDEYMALPFAMYVGALALCSNAPEGKKDEEVCCTWLIEKIYCFFYCLTVSTDSLPVHVSVEVGKQQKDFNKILNNLGSYLDVRREISFFQFVTSIEIISNRLAKQFNLNHYKPITLVFYLEESRELAARIEVFANKVAEDLVHAKRILQDQEKIGEGFGEVREGFAEVREGFSDIREGFSDIREGFSDIREGFSEVREGFVEIGKGQAEIREGFSDVRKGFAEIRENQAKLKNGVQAFEADFDELLAVFTQPQPSGSFPAQNPQQSPRSSLRDSEPSRHNKSMSRD